MKYSKKYKIIQKKLLRGNERTYLKYLTKYYKGTVYKCWLLFIIHVLNNYKHTLAVR